MSHLSKAALQLEIVAAIQRHNGRGIIAAATGSGKAKAAIDYLKIIRPKRALWVVPTEKLRDVTVPEEFTKWKAKTLFNQNVETICYQSIHKLMSNHYDIVILDEGHHITEANSVFFRNNAMDKILMLTATPPHEQEKVDILKSLKLETIFKLDVDDAVSRNVVAPYDITVIQGRLDSKTKSVKGGSKLKPFMTTETAQYNYLSNQIRMLQATNRPVPKWIYFARMRLIYNLPSKVRFMRAFMESFPEDKRIIVFCGSIDFAEKLSSYTYHSKTSDKNYILFNEKKINRLFVVKALNEGHNMTDVDIAIMTQVDSNGRNYRQRQGRAIRWRKGHHAEMYLLSTLETVEERWIGNSVQGLDKTKIKYIHSKDLIYYV